MKNSFNKFFGDANNLDSDDEEETDLYHFMKNDDSTNTLMVDLNDAYNVYADAYEFLSKKRQLSKDI